ncbi:MAG: PQQ-dependent sugar dehydrogenase [Actinobacteria bacterium]|nr:PQQ-dependent sugar dehydrogenase [Actinomycetota bacterium]
MRDIRAFFLFGTSLVIAVAVPTGATASVDPKARLTAVTTVAKPTDIASRTSDTGLYIAEQDGRVVRFDTKTKVKSTALDVTGLTGASGERGLLGLAFHPNGRFVYVNYTDDAGNTVVARYRMRADNTAEPTSRTVLFTLDQPYANHNGGGLAFGPGGRLYIGTGDGGSRDDPLRAGLDKSSMLGKIIGIDPLARNERSAAARIWSVGLRNPWRFEFDEEMNLWVADVGQDKWEEVNLARASSGSGRNANFGWSAYEGLMRFNNDQVARKHLAPVHVYQHGQEGCSISGGTKIRSAKLPALSGWYVYGDFCSGRITAIKVSGKTVSRAVRLVDNAGSVTAVRTVASGDVYVLTLAGDVSRLVAVP